MPIIPLFRPTHEIILTNQKTGEQTHQLVQLSAITGAAHTREEWEALQPASWRRGQDGFWTCRGEVAPAGMRVVINRLTVRCH